MEGLGAREAALVVEGGHRPALCRAKTTALEAESPPGWLRGEFLPVPRERTIACSERTWCGELAQVRVRVVQLDVGARSE